MGCSISQVKDGTNFTDEQVATIQAGKTTKSEVKARFGWPSAMENNNGVVTWWYKYSETHTETNIILEGERSNTASKTLTIVFDGNIVDHYSQD